ncbi:MAG: RDD family protein [Ileibacterium sp.]|nr:RDD family protein [Ileibacterium sp.]
MKNTNVDRRSFKRASMLKRTLLYKKDGWKEAVYLKRTMRDYQDHLYAYLIDLNICLLPVYLWAVEFILLLTGLISPMYFDLLFYIMYALLLICSCVALPLYTANSSGQSVGCQYLNLRIVNKNKKLAPPMQLVLRQLVGIGIPVMFFGYFFDVRGLLLWWAANGICVLASPRQQTAADWLFGTVLVKVPQINVISAQDLPEEMEEEEEEIQPQAAPAPAAVLPVQKEEPAVEFSPIDLHLRSSYSDDALTDVEEIMKLARQKDMEVISITDHNCARANAQAVRFAPMYGIQYIPGVEIDAVYQNSRVRILGYYIDWNHPFFDEVERMSLVREKEVSIARVHAFEKLMGIKIDVESILSKSRFQTITGDDLTYMVFKNAKTRQKPMVQTYLQKSGGDEERAKKLFAGEVFGENGTCSVQGTYPRADEVIKNIHEAGGLAVLASWHADKLSDEQLEGLLNEGIDGLECFMPDLSTKTVAFLLSVANQEKLFVTGGSDYHGSRKRGHEIGHTAIPAKALNMVRVFTKALDS